MCSLQNTNNIDNADAIVIVLLITIIQLVLLRCCKCLRIWLGLKPMQPTKYHECFRLLWAQLKLSTAIVLVGVGRRRHLRRCIVAYSNEIRSNSEPAVPLSRHIFIQRQKKMEWNECNVLKVNCLENVKCLRIKAAEKKETRLYLQCICHLSYFYVW